MSLFDWITLSGTLIFIVVYGIWKSRGQQNIEGYLLGDKTLRWYHVMFSVIATQASAITFLSAPGQAYTDGMRFVQFYFGMPLALIVVSAVFLPRYSKLNVFTAYQYLEQRFNVQTRALASFLFLMLRGLSAGLTIYAPAIILSTILGWNIFLTNIVMGGLVIIYTVSGGTKAVSHTQMMQMMVITTGMLLAGYMMVHLLPDDVGFFDALHIAGSLDKLNTITTNVDFSDKYNIWSGLIGGFFLSLSYFGTDQSQVGRYLAGKSVNQSRIGLLLTGFVKIPMQFFILLTGALLIALYQFQPAPLFFNQSLLNKVAQSENAQAYKAIQDEQAINFQQKKDIAYQILDAEKKGNQTAKQQYAHDLKNISAKEQDLREQTIVLIKATDSKADTNDTNYIFLDFVFRYMPQGLIGLLIAMIFCASWSSTSSELNALASTSVVDIYKRILVKNETAKHYLNVSRLITIGWGIFAIGVAQFATAMGSLIEAVNILGSLFYGTILGIFLTAFFVKPVKGNSVFVAAIISETLVILLYVFDVTAFLWLNLIGCALVMGLSLLLTPLLKNLEKHYSQ